MLDRQDLIEISERLKAIDAQLDTTSTALAEIIEHATVALSVIIDLIDRTSLAHQQVVARAREQ